MRSRFIFTIIFVTLLSLSACGKQPNETELLFLVEESIEYTNYETGLYSTMIARDNAFYEMIANNPIDSTFIWDDGAETTARISKAVEYRDLWSAEIDYAWAILKEYLTAEDYQTLEQAYEGWKQYMDNTMAVEQNMFYTGMSYGIGSNDTYPLVMEAVAERTKAYALELMALEYAFTGTVEFSADANHTEFTLGPNLSTAITELALMYDEFDSAQTQEDYYPQSFIFHFCQNSRLTFDYLEQLREEKNGILSLEDVQYIQQSLTNEMVDMGNNVPEAGIDINQAASGLGFGNIISYEADVLGEEVHLVAEFERGTDEFHPTKLYELDIVLIQNPESCFDGYSIKSLTLKEITPS